MCFDSLAFQVSVCSNPDVLDKTGYALSVATTVLSYYQEFFGIPYPLPKAGEAAILIGNMLPCSSATSAVGWVGS